MLAKLSDVTFFSHNIIAAENIRVLPGAEPHQRDWSTGEEDGDQKEGPPAPYIWQRTNQRCRHEWQQTLERRSQW